MLSAIGSALSSAAGGVESFLGSSSGSAAMSLLGKGMDMWFNHNENEQNRDLTEKLYKNKYQYAVADLLAAGLNPALAYGSLSGSSPSMSAGLGSSGGLNSAKVLHRKEVELLNNQIKAAEASAESASAKALADRIDADLKKDFWVNMGPISRRIIYGQQIMPGSSAGQISGGIGGMLRSAEDAGTQLKNRIEKSAGVQMTPLQQKYANGEKLTDSELSQLRNETKGNSRLQQAIDALRNFRIAW